MTFQEIYKRKEKPLEQKGKMKQEDIWGAKKQKTRLIKVVFGLHKQKRAKNDKHKRII